MRRIVLFGTTLIVGLAAIALGVWQLGRHAERAERNRLAMAGRALPPLIWDSLRRERLEPNRRALLMGTLDQAREFLLRNRLVAGIPAVQVVTPLRLPGSDTAVLVNRGYVPAADAVRPTAETWSEAERRAFHGVLLPVPDRGDGAPVTSRGLESWHGLDLSAMRARVPYPVSDLYLVAEPDSSTPAHTIRGTVYPFRSELPPMDGGPHLSYALQWFGIAAAVVAFGIFFVLRPMQTASTVNSQQSTGRA
ncbi:MAG TPA: SURF1 family protein [Gemmatimonadales bacterium]|nr:SURF1 family protein [Gemmatimonadales bacterium]